MLFIIFVLWVWPIIDLLYIGYNNVKSHMINDGSITIGDILSALVYLAWTFIPIINIFHLIMEVVLWENKSLTQQILNIKLCQK